MDRAMISDHLELAERHIALSERLVTQQKSLIERLERDGHDTATARSLLVEFQHSLALYREDRDRIRKELAALQARD